VAKVSSLLQAGAVLGRRFQPLEAHIPFLLQLKVGGAGRGAAAAAGASGPCRCRARCRAAEAAHVATRSPAPPPPAKPPLQLDFNLQGMGHLRLSKVLFRDPLPASSRPPAADLFASLPIAPSQPPGSGASQPPQQQPFPAASAPQQPGPSPGALGSSQRAAAAFWTAATVPPDWRWGSSGLAARDVPVRESSCQLELDGCAEHVLNRQMVGGRGDVQLGCVRR
jgi:hypothetical protein